MVIPENFLSILKIPTFQPKNCSSTRKPFINGTLQRFDSKKLKEEIEEWFSPIEDILLGKIPNVENNTEWVCAFNSLFYYYIAKNIDSNSVSRKDWYTFTSSEKTACRTRNATVTRVFNGLENIAVGRKSITIFQTFNRGKGIYYNSRDLEKRMKKLNKDRVLSIEDIKNFKAKGYSDFQKSIGMIPVFLDNPISLKSAILTAIESFNNNQPLGDLIIALPILGSGILSLIKFENSKDMINILINFLVKLGEYQYVEIGPNVNVSLITNKIVEGVFKLKCRAEYINFVSSLRIRSKRLSATIVSWFQLTLHSRVVISKEVYSFVEINFEHILEIALNSDKAMNLDIMDLLLKSIVSRGNYTLFNKYKKIFGNYLVHNFRSSLIGYRQNVSFDKLITFFENIDIAQHEVTTLFQYGDFNNAYSENVILFFIYNPSISIRTPSIFHSIQRLASYGNSNAVYSSVKRILLNATSHNFKNKERGEEVKKFIYSIPSYKTSVKEYYDRAFAIFNEARRIFSVDEELLLSRKVQALLELKRFPLEAIEKQITYLISLKEKYTRFVIRSIVQTCCTKKLDDWMKEKGCL